MSSQILPFENSKVSSIRSWMQAKRTVIDLLVKEYLELEVELDKALKEYHESYNTRYRNQSNATRG
jgi:recombinational DNA repair protein RecT